MRHVLLCGLCAAWFCVGCGGPSPVELRDEGIAEFQRGHQDKAHKLLQQSLDRSPNDARTLYFMGRLRHIRGDYEWAMFYYQRCLELDASFEVAKLWLAKAQADAGPSGERMRFVVP